MHRCNFFFSLFSNVFELLRHADSNRAGGYFFMRAKHIIGDRGVFRGGQDLFEPQIVLSAANGNFAFKKVEAPSKNLDKSPIMSCQHTKITSQTLRISGALVFYVPVRPYALKLFVLSLITVF